MSGAQITQEDKNDHDPEVEENKENIKSGESVCVDNKSNPRYRGLVPPKHGERRNPLGVNGFHKQRSMIQQLMTIKSGPKSEISFSQDILQNIRNVIARGWRTMAEGGKLTKDEIMVIQWGTEFIYNRWLGKAHQAVSVQAVDSPIITTLPAVLAAIAVTAVQMGPGTESGAAPDYVIDDDDGKDNLNNNNNNIK